MTQLEDIMIYTRTDGRDHLAFINQPIEGFERLDVGRVLSAWLKQQDLHSQFLQMEVNDELDEILDQSCEHPQIGDYLMLENIGILFEPSLQLNVRALLERHSDRKLIIILSDGFISGSKYYFMSPSDKYYIDLSGLSYYSKN